MAIPDEVLTAAEVARHLRCSKAHVYNAINGRIANVSPLPALSLGRRRLIRRSTLEEWIRANEPALADAMMPTSPEVGTARTHEEGIHAKAVPGRKSA